MRQNLAVHPPRRPAAVPAAWAACMAAPPAAALGCPSPGRSPPVAQHPRTLPPPQQPRRPQERHGRRSRAGCIGCSTVHPASSRPLKLSRKSLRKQPSCPQSAA